MAKKEEKEVEKWVTINGARVPIFKDGSIGGPKAVRDKLKNMSSFEKAQKGLTTSTSNAKENLDMLKAELKKHPNDQFTAEIKARVKKAEAEYKKLKSGDKSDSNFKTAKEQKKDFSKSGISEFADYAKTDERAQYLLDRVEEAGRDGKSEGKSSKEWAEQLKKEYGYEYSTKLHDQVSKDQDEKEKQPSKNKTQGYSREEAELQMARRYNDGEHDTVMMEKDGKYQIAKNRKEADYAEQNGWKTTEMKSSDYQRIKQRASVEKDNYLKEKQIARNKKESDERNGKTSPNVQNKNDKPAKKSSKERRAEWAEALYDAKKGDTIKLSDNYSITKDDDAPGGTWTDNNGNKNFAEDLVKEFAHYKREVPKNKKRSR